MKRHPPYGENSKLAKEGDFLGKMQVASNTASEWWTMQRFLRQGKKTRGRVSLGGGSRVFNYL